MVDLITLTWLGRGDFDRDDFDGARRLAAERHTAGSARYLTGIPTLGDYLEDGLSTAGYSCDAVELAHL